MANAKRDGNHNATLIASDSSDGVSIVLIQAIPTTNRLKILNGTTGINRGNDIAQDGNRIPVIFAVSSADGVTIIPIYAESSTGSLLVQST